MNTKTIYYLPIILLFINVSSAQAKRLLGTDYAGMMGGTVNYSSGDKSYLDDGFTVQGIYNHNTQTNIDAMFSLKYSSAEGQKSGSEADTSSLMFGADMFLSIKPHEKVNPYINVGIRALDVDVTGPDVGNDDSDIGLGVGVGVELEMNQVLLARISLQHDNVGDEASSLEALGGFWIADALLFTLSIARDFDSDATSFLAGLFFQHQ